MSRRCFAANANVCGDGERAPGWGAGTAGPPGPARSGLSRSCPYASKSSMTCENHTGRGDPRSHGCVCRTRRCPIAMAGTARRYGRFQYTGKYITRRLIAEGVRVRTLTNHPERQNTSSATLSMWRRWISAPASARQKPARRERPLQHVLGALLARGDDIRWGGRATRERSSRRRGGRRPAHRPCQHRQPVAWLAAPVLPRQGPARARHPRHRVCHTRSCARRCSLAARTS